MKNIKTTGILLAFFMLLSFATKAQGMEFFQGTFNEALAKASKEKKMVFMDAYTTWCGPCKWMAANTFTDASVGTYFNANFINVKMDMEKGEGPMLARKYAVMAYPTLLFISPSGEVIHKELGAKPADTFIEAGKKAASMKGPASAN
jgi:thiol:disulfide interchange protein